MSPDHIQTRLRTGVRCEMADRLITQAIKKADTELRNKYKFLNYQDAIGFGIFITSFVGIFSMWALYRYHGDSYGVCALIMLVVALCTSFLHELEHDLIHNLYFKKSDRMQDFMFLCIWLSKLHGNPWFRRDLHLKHHIISGQKDDAEERLIGLGLPFSLTRLAVTVHPFGQLIATPDVAKDAKWLDVQKLNLTSAPVAFLFFGLHKAFLLYVGVMLWVGYDNYHLYLPARHWFWIRAANVCLCLPNVWRQFSLVMMSNCSHYYADIPEKSVFYQNQILDHPILYPFQMFCMNFGATHIVHHYVPGQPFYIREIVYRQVKSFMVENGVRLNDFGVVSRGNRYYDESSDSNVAADNKGKRVAPNNSNMSAMLLWISLACTVGAASYVVFDQWVSAALGVRIFRKYVSKHKGE